MSAQPAPVASGRLDGRVAVVTGGAQGIGRAAAEVFVAEGASVAVLDIAPTPEPIVVDDGGTRVRSLICDITDETAVRSAFEEVNHTLGPVDVLINNAGVNAFFDALTMTRDDWQRVMAVDLEAVWLCTKYALPSMLAAGQGAIVNVSSIHATMTSPGTFPYAAAKAGVLGLTRSLALDYGPRNVRVNVVCPGWTRTRLIEEHFAHQPDPGEAERLAIEIQPMRRLGAPEEVARVIAFLASPEASYVSGAVLNIDGALSCRFA